MVKRQRKKAKKKRKKHQHCPYQYIRDIAIRDIAASVIVIDGFEDMLVAVGRKQQRRIDGKAVGYRFLSVLALQPSICVQDARLV